MDKKEIIALLVENNAGVLGRISMLFGRRGYNIDSLTVSETNDIFLLLFHIIFAVALMTIFKRFILQI